MNFEAQTETPFSGDRVKVPGSLINQGFQGFQYVFKYGYPFRVTHRV